MNCIIIDDEPLAIDVIQSYCDSVSFVKVLNTFTRAMDAIEFLNTHKVDLVFSDIEMPLISGVEMIQSLENKPLFIFTTAYSKYAVEGFNLNAVDYLVKPIPFQRFLKALNRAQEKLLDKNRTTPLITKSFANQKFIFIKSEYENIKIELDEITYIEGLKDYLKVYHRLEKPTLTLMSFKQILGKLPQHFLRVHRSYIVNINKIESVQRNRIIISNNRIPIGESYKESVLKAIGI